MMSDLKKALISGKWRNASGPPTPRPVLPGLTQPRQDPSWLRCLLASASAACRTSVPSFSVSVGERLGRPLRNAAGSVRARGGPARHDVLQGERDRAR